MLVSSKVIVTLSYFFLYKVIADSVNKEKLEFCQSLMCNVNETAHVCGIRVEGDGYRFKLFENECQLLKYGCEVEDENAYGLIDMSYCGDSRDDEIRQKPAAKLSNCVEFDCTYPTDANMSCGIQQEGDKYKIRIFKNKCDLLKFNCENHTNFTITDFFICKDLDSSHLDNLDTPDFIKDRENVFQPNKETKNPRFKIKNMIVVDSTMLNLEGNINETIDNFFAATHILDLPLKEVNSDILNETTRRRLIKMAGPVKVYKPWIVIPKEIKDDHDHLPLLNTCFHKCPKKCPDTYAPVCGNPGFLLAREPSLMFQNHCYMDVAQCKMYWENKSETARSSAYIEASFTFCLGVEMNGLYRFLPLVRTLQHMGRLKKKGVYKYKMHNMKIFNEYLMRQPNIMG